MQKKITRLTIANSKRSAYYNMLNNLQDVLAKLDLDNVNLSNLRLNYWMMPKNPWRLITRTISEYDCKKNKTRTSKKDLLNYIKLLKGIH